MEALLSGSSSYEVVPQLFNGSLEGEGFSFHSCVVPLSRGQFSAHEDNEVFLSIEILG